MIWHCFSSSKTSRNFWMTLHPYTCFVSCKIDPLQLSNNCETCSIGPWSNNFCMTKFPNTSLIIIVDWVKISSNTICFSWLVSFSYTFCIYLDPIWSWDISTMWSFQSVMQINSLFSFKLFSELCKIHTLGLLTLRCSQLLWIRGALFRSRWATAVFCHT